MPTYSLSGPDGGEYEVDAPNEAAALAAHRGMFAAPLAAPTGEAPLAFTVQPPENRRPAMTEAETLAAEQATGMAPAPNLATDLIRSAGSGISTGLTGLAGLPADVAGLAAAGADRFQAWKESKPLAEIQARNDAAALIKPSTIAKAGGASLQSMSPLDYTPQTQAGRYAESVASFAPSALAGPGGLMRKFVMGALAPGVASEAAGQATAGTRAEPFARIAGAVAAPAALGRAITPVRASDTRRALTDVMDREGISLTAGQRTGSRPLQWFESTLGDTFGAGGKAAELSERQGRQLNSALARRMGETAEVLDGPTMAQAASRIGNQFETLSARNTLRPDAQFAQDLGEAASRYGRKLPSQTREPFDNTIRDLAGVIQQNGGMIPGTVYQQARSDLNRIVQSSKVNDPAYSYAMRGIRNALDDGMERSIAGTADAGAWKEARQQYSAMKLTEKALEGRGQGAAEGFVSPDRLRSAAQQADRSGYVRGQGDLNQLARAAGGTMGSLPQSGTAPRAEAAKVMQMASGLVASAFGGASPTLLAAGAAGLAGPALAGRGLLSRPVQGWLGNNRISEGEGLLPLMLRVRSGQVGAHEGRR